MNALNIGQLKRITGSLASEIVFAEAGKDNGLLPVNSLLAQIDGLLADATAPDALTHAVRSARGWVDAILDTTGVFSAPLLQNFTAWSSWMQNAVGALEQQTPLPALPGDWDLSGSSAAPKDQAPASVAMSALEEPTLTLNIEADGELLREFINESNEHLLNIEQGVLVLEENPMDADTLSTIFRAFHTF